MLLEKDKNGERRVRVKGASGEGGMGWEAWDGREKVLRKGGETGKGYLPAQAEAANLLLIGWFYVTLVYAYNCLEALSYFTQ
jgi:hypothetical protein